MIHTRAPVERYESAISFMKADFPEPEVPTTAAL